MISNEELIQNFELKIQQLVNAQNENHLSGDNSSSALHAYFKNQAKIDRLNLCVKALKKRGAR